ncbi:MAG: hypothetical protein M3P30_08325 [Chloroflexota bacterium]|nr:hypothetical protein [Chloroflexota bacterium]
MPIENREMAAGTVLVARHKKEERTCEVVQTDDGLRFKTDDGELFKSPSSAAKHVMGGVAANGWRFWSIAGTEKPKREAKARAATKKPARAKKGAKSKSAKKAKAAKKPKGKAMRAKATDVASYGCGACGATFGSQKAAVNHALTHTS